MALNNILIKTIVCLQYQKFLKFIKNQFLKLIVNIEGEKNIEQFRLENNNQNLIRYQCLYTLTATRQNLITQFCLKLNTVRDRYENPV